MIRLIQFTDLLFNASSPFFTHRWQIAIAITDTRTDVDQCDNQKCSYRIEKLHCRPYESRSASNSIPYTFSSHPLEDTRRRKIDRNVRRKIFSATIARRTVHALGISRIKYIMKHGDTVRCVPHAIVPHATGNPCAERRSGPESLAREPLTALVTLQHSSWGRINHASFNRPNDIPLLTRVSWTVQVLYWTVARNNREITPR